MAHAIIIAPFRVEHSAWQPDLRGFVV